MCVCARARARACVLVRTLKCRLDVLLDLFCIIANTLSRTVPYKALRGFSFFFELGDVKLITIISVTNIIICCIPRHFLARLVIDLCAHERNDKKERKKVRFKTRMS